MQVRKNRKAILKGQSTFGNAKRPRPPSNFDNQIARQNIQQKIIRDSYPYTDQNEYKGPDINQPYQNPVITPNSSGFAPNPMARGFRPMKRGNAMNSLDEYSMRYINMVANPFGTDSRGIDHVNINAGVKIPSLNPVLSFPYYIYRKTTVAFTTEKFAEICLSKPTSDHGVSLEMVYGSSNTSPTAHTTLYDGATDANWFASTLVKNYRIVAAGLKANVASPLDMSSVVFSGTPGDATSPFTVLGSAYNTFSDMNDSNDPQTFSTAQGITVRYDPNRSNDTNQATNTSITSWAQPAGITTASYTDMPRIAITIGSNCSITFEFVIYLEMIPVDKSNCPLVCGTAPRSRDWQKVQMILGDVQRIPVVAHGHSFSDFFKGLWDGIKRTGKGIMNFMADPKTAAAVSTIMKVLAPLVIV